MSFHWEHPPKNLPCLSSIHYSQWIVWQCEPVTRTPLNNGKYRCATNLDLPFRSLTHGYCCQAD
eukprot:24559-Amphidinium_carterae.1